MAYQVGKPVTVPARGDAPQRKPGPTPAPTKTYVNPVVVERSAPSGYGVKDLGPSSIEPGTKRTSPLADELKRMGAQGDGGDALQDVIEQGVRTHAGADQTRKVDPTQYPTTYGLEKRGPDSGSPGGTVPSKCGESAAPDPKDPNV
jgi:hypothetical protein